MTEGSSLSQRQLQDLQKWLAAKTRGNPGTCGVCHQSKWSVLDSFVCLRTVDCSGQETGSAYPHVALSCSNCGNTVLLNALKTGLWS